MTTPYLCKNLSWPCKPWAWKFLLALFFLRVMAGPASAQTALKLALQAPSQSFRAGEEIEIEITLRDANEQPAAAPKDLAIEINARTAADSVILTKQETIPAGANSKKFRLTINEVGIIYVWARHPELLTGGIDLLIKKSKPVSPAPPSKGVGLAQRQARLLQVKPVLTLRFSPQRRFLADGKDFASVQAFLLNADEIPPQEIRVRLFNSAGEFAPLPPLVIASGQDVGTLALTSNKVNTVKVEFLGATPVADLQGDRIFTISYAPAITQLALIASPPKITLVDNAEIILRLLDKDNNPVATDEPRLVSLAIDAGRGEIAARELTIDIGKFEARTTFLPTWRGKVIVSGSTPNLPITTESLQVTLPLVLLSLSALGGLVGGLIAFWVGKDSRWWRVAIGLVSGFVLYWAFVFGVLGILPRAAVLNPLSAFVLSTLGGWLGTEVFTQILKRLGLVAAK